MNFLSLIRVNIKKIIKTPIHLLFFLLLPLGTILFTTVIIDGMDSVGGFPLPRWCLIVMIVVLLGNHF